MKTSYPLQRQINNADPNSLFILYDWPFLRNESVFLAHANMLLEIDLRNQIADAYLAKAPRLNNFFQSSATCVTDSDILDNAVEKQITTIQAVLPVVIGCVLKTMGEDKSSIFLLSDTCYSTKTTVVKTVVHQNCTILIKKKNF